MLKLHDLIEPAVSALNFDLWGCEYLTDQAYSGGVLRVYVEGQNGVSVGDCESLSRQISAILDVEDPIPGSYRLEVSSPGLERPLFKPSQYERFTGSVIKLKLRIAVQDRRNFKGKLEQVDDKQITIIVDGVSYVIPFTSIEKAHVVFESGTKS